MTLKALSIKVRCRRCRQPMRNDGTEANPIWVCNNPSCVCYVPPTDDNEAEEE